MHYAAIGKRSLSGCSAVLDGKMMSVSRNSFPFDRINDTLEELMGIDPATRCITVFDGIERITTHEFLLESPVDGIVQEYIAAQYLLSGDADETDGVRIQTLKILEIADDFIIEIIVYIMHRRSSAEGSRDCNFTLDFIPDLLLQPIGLPAAP